MHRRAVAALFFALACAAAPAHAAKLYFVDYDTEPLPGGGITDRFSLHRVNLDGSQPDEVLHDMGPQPAYASMAVHDGVVYWRDLFNATRAATTAGVLLGPTSPPNAQVGAALLDQALDSAGVHTYFPARAESGQFDRILRGDFEFENPVTFVNTREFEPNVSIALDEPAGKIYWAGAWGGGATGLVQRANLADGSNVETLLEGFAQDDFPVDLALDPPGGKMYIGNDSLFKIQRANLDGSGLEDVVTDTYVFALAIDPVPEPGAVAVVGISVAGLLRRRRTDE
jgi:PEP-CTERM motif